MTSTIVPVLQTVSIKNFQAYEYACHHTVSRHADYKNYRHTYVIIGILKYKERSSKIY